MRRWSIQRAAAGVTLIELLVVIAVLMMVTAAAIPIVAPSIQTRRVREATRLVSTYLAGARGRAIETGRPVGVMIERYTPGLAAGTATVTSGGTTTSAAASTPQPYSMTLSTVQTLPPYAGDYTGSVAYVCWTQNSLGQYFLYVDGLGMNLGSSSNQLYDNIGIQKVQIGDRVRFNYQGPFFTIMSATQLDSNNQYITGVTQQAGLTLAPYSMTTTSLGTSAPISYLPPSGMPAYSTDPNAGIQGVQLPYQIFRQPIRSSDPPLQLPEGIVIDMQWSGMSTELNGVFLPNTNYPRQSPIISFAPNGGVDMLYDQVYQHASGPIYLLLGRAEQVTTFPTTSTPYPQNNLGDLNSQWVTVIPQTGQILSNPNANPTFSTNKGYVGMNQFGTTPAADVVTARSMATGMTNGNGVVTTLGGE